MFHNRTLNNKINRLHERALRLVYTDEKLSFHQLLEMDNSVSIHHRNLQRLAIEMYKIKNKVSPLPIQDLFVDKRCWETTNIRTVSYGTESIRYRGPKTWDLVPSHIKEAKSLSGFKSKIKAWKPLECTCRLCKTFIPELGFIN